MHPPGLLKFGNPSPDARTVVLYGTCQAAYVAMALSQLDDLADQFCFVVASSFPLPGEERARPVTDDLARQAALILAQHEDRPDNPAYAALLSQVPAGCPVIRFPVLLLTCAWPFECPDPRGQPEPAYVWKRFPFGDMIGLEIAKTGLTGPLAVAAYLDLSAERMPDLRVRQQRDLDRMYRHDERCEVRIADFVESRFREEHLFWTYGHVSVAGVVELTRRIARAARPVLGGTDAGFEARTPAIAALCEMGGVQHPIHPLVAEALGLKFYEPGMRFRWYAQNWTFFEYIERYIAYDTNW